MASIKAIEAKTVHQIQSGQVIVDLCSVVKELVENSVDAGASSIDVRFKNQGLDSIEIQDNGSGISPDNYETLALKHYTSKLSTYADLSTLQTFGFRGEALSSLCALSKFSVTTCLEQDAPKGSRLEFEVSGKLRGTSVVAAQKGTTISVDSLFHNLPVRRRELERNIKREWNRVIGILNQYACILTGIKFSVSQQPNKGKKVVLFATKGNQTTRENIVNVFGSKTLAVLIPLDLEMELEPTPVPPAQKWIMQEDKGGTKEVRVRGHVSRPAHGEGRQTPDRQMFFVNGRPCGLPQFAKVFNEVYKSYNSSQSPFIFADIQLDTHMYDVNVSPDKRTILLHDQSRLLDNLRESLTALFEAQDYSVPVSQLAFKKQTPFKKPPFIRRETTDSDAMSSSPVPDTEGQPSLSRSRAVSEGVSKLSAIDDTADSEVEQERAAQGEREVEMDSHRDIEDTAPYEDEEGTADVSAEGTNTPTATVIQNHGTNLLSRWVRTESSDVRESPETSAGLVARVSRTNSKEKRVYDLASSAKAGSEEIGRSPSPSLAIPSSSPSAEPEGESKRVQDFNAHLARLGQKRSVESSHDGSQVANVEESAIPAITSPCRVTQTVGSSYRAPNNPRMAPEIATITIGNDTVTSVVGSPAKRQRLDRPANKSSSPRSPRPKRTASIPSFQGRLTQMFSASAKLGDHSPTAQEITTTMEEVSDEEPPSSQGELFVEEDDQIAGDGVSHDEELGSSVRSSQHEDDIAPQQANEEEEEEDKDYEDEDENKRQEDNRVQSIIDAAEAAAKAVSEESEKRQQSFVKGGGKRKDSTFQLLQKVRMDDLRLRNMVETLDDSILEGPASSRRKEPAGGGIDAVDAEEKLSLTIAKTDFAKMKIIGQFNLGFILAVRMAEKHTGDGDDEHRAAASSDDELFIIDQHATDEKYNFERLQATTVVQSQRLVQPKTLELTAVEEEIVKEHVEALEANGFSVSIDESGDEPVGSRVQLLSLPLSRETTFSLADLEELISLLTEHHSMSANTIPRPSKVRKMFAMRACRSSVMIGKSLPNKQMEKLVRHMGELDKPWNCPHGRPTMRHLSGLGVWDGLGWREDDGGEATKWEAFIAERRGREAS